MTSQRAKSKLPALRWLFAALPAAALLAGLIAIATGTAAAERVAEPTKSAQGKGLYRAWCRTCHGETARGDGPMAEYLRVPPTDLTLLSQTQGGFDFDRVAAKIDGRENVRGHGSKDMPVWGEAFKVVEEFGGENLARAKITALVHYLRSIQAAADAGSQEPDRG